jgi:hypothetical protein
MKDINVMHWPAALYTATIWLLLTSLWQMYWPFPQTASHGAAALRVARDIVPGLLLGILAGLML